ncbi:DUF2069 domain-containing protein [Pseudomonas sp. F1_0610]|uniref:DUF2069 domain-containing protein n=1 Tax=Pseudomonas sp. F1_0610 TaxID=3114284 RepID=UPI0039C22CCF
MGYTNKAKKPLPSIEWLEPRARKAHLVAIIFLFALITLLSYWNIFLVDHYNKQVWALIAYESIPLILVLPGILKGSPYAYSWACFAILLHFLEGVWMLMEPQKQWIGVAETLITTGFFISAMYYIRWKYQLIRKHNGE